MLILKLSEIWDEFLQRNIQINLRNTCEGRCNHHTFSDCRCDSDCVSYGDCCIDYHSVCLQESTKLSDTWIHPMYHTCHAIAFSTSFGGVLVSRCALSWQDRDVKSRCLNQTDGMPVSDQYGFNFRNVFCAICHYRKLRQLYPWHTVPSNSLDCVRSKLRRGQTLKVVKNKDASIIGTRYRQCYNNDTCPSNTNATLAKNCQIYRLTDPSCLSHQFKNDYCYLCHGGESILCTQLQGQFGIGIKNEYQKMWKFKPPKQSFYLKMCMPNEVRDPITQMCRKTACKVGYKSLASGCVISNDISLHITNNWKCSQQNVMFFFKSDTTVNVDKSTCLINKIRNRRKIISWEYNFKLFDNTEWTAFDIIHENVFPLLHDLHNEIETEMVDMDKVQEILCGVNDMEIFITCDKQPYADLNTNCQNHSYTGTSSDFLNIYNTSKMDLVLYVPGGIYIKIIFVLYYEHSSFKIRPTKTIDSVFVCGSPVKETVLDCVFIILNAAEYNIKNNGTILVYGGQELTTDEFFILPDHRARVCFNSLKETKGDNTTTTGFFSTPLDAVSFVTTCISLSGLMGTLTTYIRFKRLRNIYGQGIMSLSISLMSSQILAILADKLYLPGSACVIFAAMNHYFWLATFTWTTILALILSYMFGSRQIHRADEGIKKSLAVQVSGWGVPLIIIGPALITHFCDCLWVGNFVFYDSVTCWIRSGLVNWFAFGLPVACSLGINVILMIITLYKLRKARHFSNRMQNKLVESDRWREAVLFVKVIYKLYKVHCFNLGVTR